MSNSPVCRERITSEEVRVAAKAVEAGGNEFFEIITSLMQSSNPTQRAEGNLLFGARNLASGIRSSASFDAAARLYEKGLAEPSQDARIILEIARGKASANNGDSRALYQSLDRLDKALPAPESTGFKPPPPSPPEAVLHRGY